MAFRLSRSRLALMMPTIGRSPVPAILPSQLAMKEPGTRFDDAWSLSFVDAATGHATSPWHNLPLAMPNRKFPTPGESMTISPQTHFLFVNEIAKGMRQKLECSTTKAANPLVQDRNKDGSLRLFTYDDLPFNYGFLPRTFENPEVVDTRTGKLGDGDPVDVVCLDPTPKAVGQVSEVRIVGAFALLDQGETDWKMLAVPIDSPWKNIDHVPTQMLYSVHRWFQMYKTTDGKPENRFAFDGKPVDADYAIEVIAETAQQYLAVASGKVSTTMGKKTFWFPSA